MDPQPSPYSPASEDAPPPSPRRVPRVAIAVGLTALFGLAGAGLAFASGGGGRATGAALSASSSTTNPANPPAKGPRNKAMRPGFRFGGPRGFGGRVLHGEYTVKDGTGNKTFAEQVGQVMSVSSTSITVQSDDGFTQTYAVQSSTVVDSQAGGISTVAGKDVVRIAAVVSGSTQTATNIVDTTKIGASRKGFGYPEPPAGFEGPGGPGGPGASTQAGPAVPA